MTFFDLEDGDEFTVPDLSGSFVKVTEESVLYNAVSTFDSHKCFRFNADEVVVMIPKEVEDCE